MGEYVSAQRLLDKWSINESALQSLILSRKITPYERKPGLLGGVTPGGGFFLQPISPDEGVDLLEDTDKRQSLYFLSEVIKDFVILSLAKQLSKKDYPYVFKNTAPTWEITYEKKKMNVLKGLGFAYIFFLISHSPDTYGVEELDNIGRRPDSSGELDHEELTIKRTLSDQRIGDEKTISYLKGSWSKLKKELKVAEDNNDLIKAEQKRKELEDFKRQIYENRKSFTNDTIKAMERVNRNLRTALNTIKEIDVKAYDHFYSALKPLKSKHHAYHPNPVIDWKFK
ncbi:MAG: hypothetical protein V1714_01585 [Pseudomonadota bacterium]